MSNKEKIIWVGIREKDYDADGCKLLEICREISIKETTEDCERTSLYPEENCGQPTSYMVCEVIPGNIRS